ncbi:AI-2E family transporter [Compostimonas suwonensis]|uniref:Putative PurR-regulated permease PerM n=1 Tax=Compostimonas suwonensis TaxID=1048394 RepID=A0A2M9BZT5_9MICO|nr:AI-2E family transporter [Compostimonas suwonensis]PJJ63570.1 putative PurR-regulated permease PerM [Compostimonas suwonensis]
MKIQNPFRVGLIGTLGVGLGLLILLSVTQLSTILTYVGVALFLALGLDPIVTWLEKQKFPRWAAIITVFVAVLAVFAGLVLAVVPVIVDQVSQFIERVPAIINNVTSQDWLDAIKSNLPWLDVDTIVAGVTDAVNDFVKDPTNFGNLFGGVLAVGVAIGNGVFGVIIVLILTLYFTASLNTIKRASYQLVPATKRERYVDISEQVSQSVGRYVIGQVVLGATNGILSFIFLNIIGAPFPAVLAFLAFILSLIPLIGTISGSVIIVLVCLLLASPLTALVAAIYYLVYMQVEAYILSPRIMNRAVSVPGAVVVIAALAGGSLLGILGALVAIPVAASILLIIKQVVIPRQNEL